MGIRSMNYLVLSAGAMTSRPLPDLVKHLLGGSPVQTRLGAQLYVFESNFAPMWSRDQGRSVVDLRSELELQEYLNRFSVNDFRLVRVGAETDSRGQWLQHPHVQHSDVLELEAAYAAAVQAESEPQPETL